MKQKSNTFKLRWQILSLLIFAISSWSSAQETSRLMVNNILQSNMVIQQGKPFKVWGIASPGEQVFVSTDWNKSSSNGRADESGRFMVEVSVPKAIKGDYSSHQLQVYTANDTVKLSHLLIGDVWFLSGQSNMQFSLKEDKYADANLPLALDTNIRLFNTALNFSASPISDVKGKWTTCAPQTAKDFSAVGYYFGAYLKKVIDIPVGLVFSGIGASKVEAFIPQDVLQRNPLLNTTYLQPYLADPKSKEKVDGGFSFEKVTRPFLLYNAMINPFTPLSITGFCWYQGEGNRTERESYTLATQKLITTWRSQFNQGNLPFYYVQVAPFFWDKEDPKLADYAFFREAQQKIAKVKNTAMVVSMDVGEAKDLHPKNKGPLGVRLAKSALNLTYNIDTVIYKGPEFQKAKFNGSQVEVMFKPETVASGLTTRDGSSPAFFEVAGIDRKFYPAKAQISGKKIILSTNTVTRPVAVRYAFTNYAVTNLQNSAGLPAIPFRTDNWPE
ncbi:sialate O-acetylesterase [Pedobacter sandarakinus]|uniref:sialate O-acetylesterase n=1 Tax=Pedobacter sandarakinus TaxID=353156 RepID=UPI0022484276|nr:sialate O-acetylesterase [Pedobacter sandarakinus]MCX2574120.1 sialate O-acetylesterase [Pedobacter sandarakinus]